MKRSISNLALRRMTAYLAYLKSLPEDSPKNVSATMIANALQLGDVQVRKDLAKIARPGHTKVGRDKAELIWDIERCIGLDKPVTAVLIGTDDFLPWFSHQCGDRVVISARFSADPISQGKDTMALSELPRFCRDHPTQIGILNVSSDMLYPAADLLAESGVRAIWNFSPVPLESREGVVIQNENLLPTLGILSYYALHPAPARKPAED